MATTSKPEQTESINAIPEQSDEPKEEEDVVETTPPNKDNNLSKLSSLNLSGTLITSFTPSKPTVRSSLRTTPLKNSPVVSSAAVSTPKPVLNESSNLNRSTMHLVDLTGTPLVKRNAKTPGSSKRTPLSVKKTPTVRTATKNETLLKSAIKNSSIKKRFNDSHQAPQSAAKGKVLFQSPIMDASNASSSVVSVSFCSAQGESPNTSFTENESVVEVKKEEEIVHETKSVSECSHVSQDGSESDEDTKKLLDNISVVLDENTATTPQKSKSLLPESERTQDIEKNFEKILEDTTIQPTDQIESEFKNIQTPENADDPQKKAESLLNWIETTRESLASNNTEQVLSSRYSNVTPNDSVVTTIAYDAKTPKMSILDTVQDMQKSGSLAMSPVARLSINDNSTVVVENFKLNNDIPKSLRSTRKRIGKAMSSLHDISQNPNSTFDETLNFSQLINTPLKDQSILEASSNDILSLDDQQPAQDANESIVERDENAENIPPAMTSNNFIDFANHNDNDETEKEFFEISNSEIDESDMQEIQESSSSSEESEESENDSDIEEIVGSSQETSEDKSNNVALKFRLSEQDLEEDGINPLELSSRTDNGNESNQQVENEDIEIPATQNMDDIEIPATEEILTDQMNEMIDGNCSIGFLDSKTEEIESMIEEHLEEPEKSQQEILTTDADVLEANSLQEIRQLENETVTLVNDEENEASMVVEALEMSNLSATHVLGEELGETPKEPELEELTETNDEVISSDQVVENEQENALNATISAETISDEQSESENVLQGASSGETVLEAKPSTETIDDDMLTQEQDEMIDSDEINAENEISKMEEKNRNESIELFATQTEDYAIPEEISEEAPRVSDSSEVKSIFDTPVKDQSDNEEENEVENVEEEKSLKASTVLDSIDEESVSIKISVSVERSPEIAEGKRDLKYNIKFIFKYLFFNR